MSKYFSSFIPDHMVLDNSLGQIREVFTEAWHCARQFQWVLVVEQWGLEFLPIKPASQASGD